MILEDKKEEVEGKKGGRVEWRTTREGRYTASGMKEGRR